MPANGRRDLIRHLKVNDSGRPAARASNERLQPLHLLSHRTFRSCCFSPNFNTRNWTGNIFLETGAELNIKMRVLSSKISVLFSWLHSIIVPRPPRCWGFEITLRHTYSVRLLWTSDRPVVETSTWQHSTLTRHSHPSPTTGRNSSPQSQKAVTGIGSIISYCSEN